MKIALCIFFMVDAFCVHLVQCVLRRKKIGGFALFFSFSQQENQEN